MKIVNSWNDFDPLKHVIVGRADNCCIPPFQIGWVEAPILAGLAGATVYAIMGYVINRRSKS